jgi:hypothetical protein
LQKIHICSLDKRSSVSCVPIEIDTKNRLSRAERITDADGSIDRNGRFEG